MRQFTAGSNDSGQRLDRFISKAVPALPAALSQKYIRLGRIKVNGRKAVRDVRLKTGDTVDMYINDEFFETPDEQTAYLRNMNAKLNIVYEDENLILVNKPAGVVCHSAGGYEFNTLVSAIQAYLYNNREWNPRSENAFTPALCNRIDRNTQGIVIAAKNAETLRLMNEKIRLRQIDKRYIAVVIGVPKPASGLLKHNLFKDAKKNQVFLTEYSESPKPGVVTAITEYRTLDTCTANGMAISLVESCLVTGRTHQIRAQLSSLGTPILGDGKYGSEKIRRAFNETKGQLLCSYKLSFNRTNDNSTLCYLDGRVFTVKKIDFVEKYFPETKLSLDK